MIDFINDDYLTVNLANNNLANKKWFVKLLQELSKYYDMDSPLYFLNVKDQNVRIYVLDFFRRKGLVAEFFNFEDSTFNKDNYGFVFKNNESLSQIILMYT